MYTAALTNSPAAALHQPDWPDTEAIARARAALSARPGLVTVEQIYSLRSLLAAVAMGEAHLIQAGDCAEDPVEATLEHVARKAGMLDILAGTMRMTGYKPVVRVGRIAGQFAKPRSQPTETVGGIDVPTYRGHMVNGFDPDPVARRFDPARLLTGYDLAGAITGWLGWNAELGYGPLDPPVWTSHEALLLDYEVPMTRTDKQGRVFLTSTHLPWIGARTCQPDGAHVDLLSNIVNPVACKVGPSLGADELLAITERLDPDREPGRLVLISRMGHNKIGEQLPRLVSAVRANGHPVIWVCDPMHGNTVHTGQGLKTRRMEDVLAEIRQFQDVVNAAGGVGGGLHLEVSPEEVVECSTDGAQQPERGPRYTTLCDPRLNMSQAVAAVAAWRPDPIAEPVLVSRTGVAEECK